MVPGGGGEDKAKLAHANSGAATTFGGEVMTRPAQPGDAAARTSSGEDRTTPARGNANARTSLGSGVVRPQGTRIDWASLLQRVFLEHVLACPCGGQRRIVSDMQDRDAVVAILAHLGLPTEPPPIARARDPAELGFA